ncbi:hypothetical protein AB0L34_29830 [Micromonospora sp. NPDC052213]
MPLTVARTSGSVLSRAARMASCWWPMAVNMASMWAVRKLWMGIFPR